LDNEDISEYRQFLLLSKGIRDLGAGSSSVSSSSLSRGITEAASKIFDMIGE